MNNALTLHPPVPFRLGPLPVGRLLVLVAAFLFASAVSLAPTIVRTAAAASHSEVCKCAHCPGGAACCCRQSGKCATP